MLNNSGFITFCLVLSALRITIEFLPLKRKLLPLIYWEKQNFGTNHFEKIHRTGLFLVIGYFILFIPNMIL